MFLLGLCAGCAADRPPSMVPDATVGCHAVEVAMDAWKRGEESGRLTESRPRVQVVDTSRKKGQILDSYEILGDATAERFRVFTVRATLSRPDEVRTERFLVLGIDPILVFLEEDYQLITHWDHRMPETSGGGSP